MPISSTALHHYRPQTDGRANVREVHTDALGVEITRDYKTTKTEAEVVIDMNTRDLTTDLEGRDFDEVMQWVLDGNDPNTFDYLNRDVNKNKAEERITRIFARTTNGEALRLAWWIDSIGPARWDAITLRLGWLTARKARVKARAATLNAAVAEYDASENV